MKRKIFLAMLRLLKVKDGDIPPGWLTWVFFPLLKYATTIARVRYDFSSLVYTIEGVKISELLIREWGREGIPEGDYFKLLKREKDGAIYVERFTPVQRQPNHETLGFEQWWEKIGNALPPRTGIITEEVVKRIAEESFLFSERQQKVKWGGK